MRILIQNYTSIISTEPMYFAKSFEVAGHDVHLWSDNNISAFDMFDSFSPDLFITHFEFLTNDAVRYLSQNKNIQIVVNCTGLSNDKLKMIESKFSENKINCPFLFTNAGSVIPYVKPEKMKMESILPGLDVFLPPEQLPDFRLDTAVISLDVNQELEGAIKDKETFHLLKLTTQSERDKNFDMPVNILSLRGVYPKYKEIIFTTPMNIVFSQLFYEATFYSDKVGVRIQDEEQDLFDKFLSSVFKEQETDDLAATLKSQIKSNHSAISRTARLCKFLKDSETKLKLEKMRGTF